MINHLTEDQISRWSLGQAGAQEQRHVQVCRACAAEVEVFARTLESLRDAVTARAEWLTYRAAPGLSTVLTAQARTLPKVKAARDAQAFDCLIESPSLLVSLKRVVIDTLHGSRTQTTVAPGAVKEIWSKNEFRHARWLSLAVHAALIALLMIPVTVMHPIPSDQTLVTLYNKALPLIVRPSQQEASHGGGGGGLRTPAPPSKGVPPKSADQQLVPPVIQPRNLMPDLAVESTIVAPQLETLRALNVQIGDPNGIVGPPSAGPGTGGGIGTGTGTGIGPGKGPGLGPGEGGGAGGGVYAVGGGVSGPVILSQVQPEYSDDARKGRIQGSVELLIVVRADGTVQFESVQKRLGYGLDQRAIDAVKKWTFVPGKKDGRAVPVYVSVIVNFSLR
jgi:protein TonB